MYLGNQDSGDVGGYCEKSGLGEIYRVESPKCGGGCGWHFDMLGQEGFGYFGLGGGSVLFVLLIQDYRKWGYLGFYGSVWYFYQSGKGGYVGRTWGNKRPLG